MSCSVPCIRCWMAAKPNPMSYTHPCTVSSNVTIKCNAMQCNAMQCNAMQCNAMQWHSPTLEQTLCHAPFLAYAVLGRSPCHPAPSSEHTVMASEFERVQSPRPAVQYTTIQCNAMQCNAMQCNAMAQPNARKNAMSCSVPCIRCPRALAMPSSPIF